MNLLHLVHSRIRSFSQLVLASFNPTTIFRARLVDPATHMPGRYLLLDELCVHPQMSASDPVTTASSEEDTVIVNTAEISTASSPQSRPKSGPCFRRPASATASPYIAASILHRELKQASPTPHRGLAADLEPSSSFTLSLLPIDEPPLLSLRLPASSSEDSVFCSPSLMRDRSDASDQETRCPGGMTCPDVGPNRLATADLGSPGTGLGIQFLSKDGDPFNGIGILSCHDSDISLILSELSSPESDVPMPSRILLDEIYRTFASHSPMAIGFGSPSLSSVSSLEGESSSFDEDGAPQSRAKADEDDVFVEKADAGPVAYSTPLKGIGKSRIEPLLHLRDDDSIVGDDSMDDSRYQLGRSYSKPTLSSLARRVRSESREVSRLARTWRY